MTKKTLALAALILALAMPGAALASSHGDERWKIRNVDEEGNPVGKRNAFESVAIVEGPRDLRLEVGCNRNDRRFLRVRKVTDEGADILGEDFRPMIQVFYKGNRLYSERQEQWTFNAKRGSYQGRNDHELNDAIARGLRLVIEAPQQDWRATFSLDGSFRALQRIDCK